MNMPSRINTGFQLCDGSDSEGKVKDASISPTLSHVEALELQKISRIAESIETQEDFLTRIYEGVSGHFPHLSFVLIISGKGCSSNLLHTANIKTSSSSTLFKYVFTQVYSLLLVQRFASSLELAQSLINPLTLSSLFKVLVQHYK